MANDNLDYSIPLATFLATVVGNATYASIVQTAKTDLPGSEVAAGSIPQFGGQLYVNLLDDAFLEQYRINQGNQLITHDSTDDTKASIATLDTLTANGDAVYIRATVTARDGSTPGVLLDAHLGGLFYRSGGSISVLNPVSSVSRVGLTAAVPLLLVSGNDIIAQVKGESSTDIAWDFTVDELRRLR